MRPCPAVTRSLQTCPVHIRPRGGAGCLSRRNRAIMPRCNRRRGRRDSVAPLSHPAKYARLRPGFNRVLGLHAVGWPRRWPTRFHLASGTESPAHPPVYIGNGIAAPTTHVLPATSASSALGVRRPVGLHESRFLTLYERLDGHRSGTPHRQGLAGQLLVLLAIRRTNA